MQCSNCRRNVGVTHKFCPHCGHRLIADVGTGGRAVREPREESKWVPCRNCAQVIGGKPDCPACGGLAMLLLPGFRSFRNAPS